ncbi:MAG: universal stress protein [Desulfobacterales bacterium]
MKLEKILWPTDFSSNAQAALPLVQLLSEQYETQVHVLYVIPELADHGAWYGEFDTSHIQKIHEWEEKTAQKRLEEICEDYLKGCPLYVKHIAAGDAAEEILKTADRENVDLVVMATRGRKNRFYFGSVAEAVLKNSKKPVLTVPV